VRCIGTENQHDDFPGDFSGIQITTHRKNASDENQFAEIPKTLTGIQGFDQMTRGGLPRGCATLVTGGPGSGKTVFGLQTLVNGATLFDEPGLFVAFEERSRKILANVASFGWPLSELKDPWRTGLCNTCLLLWIAWSH
jgi:predicted ATP-dependent serine protease